MRILFLLAFSLLVSNYLNAQWRAVRYDDVLVDTIFSISDSPFSPKISFFFPPFGVDLAAKPLKFGYNILFDKKGIPSYANATNAEGFLTFVGLGKQSFIAIDKRTRLVQRVYAKNIKSYTIYCYSSIQKKIIIKEFRIEKPGYQIPSIEMVGGWEGTHNIDFDLPFVIDGIVIRAEANDKTKKPEFVIGQFLLGSFERKRTLSNHPFINKLVGVRENLSDSWVFGGHNDFERISPIIVAGGEDGINQWDVLGGHTILEYTGDTLTLSKEFGLFRQLLTQLLDNYQFYDERGLDQSAIMVKYTSLMDGFKRTDSASWCGIIEQMQNFVNVTFRDPHFQIDLKACGKRNPQYSYCPIRSLEVNGALTVAANFSPENGVKLGSKIESIDGVLVDSLLSNGNYDLLNSREKKIFVAGLLAGHLGDSSTLGINENGSTQHYVIHYTDSLVIPDNFKPVHGQYKILAENIFYLKLNGWLNEDSFIFYNNEEQILKSKGIILDLRGNSGGEGIVVRRILSFFFDRPMPLYRVSVLGTDNYATAVIEPDTRLNIPPNIPLMVLVDGRSICAAELFAYSIRKRPSTLVVGAESTNGYLETVMDFNFPSGLTVRSSISQKKIFDSGSSLENTGVTPDVFVSITNYRDLYAYSDKVLQAAIKLILSYTK